MKRRLCFGEFGASDVVATHFRGRASARGWGLERRAFVAFGQRGCSDHVASRDSRASWRIKRKEKRKRHHSGNENVHESHRSCCKN